MLSITTTSKFATACEGTEPVTLQSISSRPFYGNSCKTSKSKNMPTRLAQLEVDETGQRDDVARLRRLHSSECAWSWRRNHAIVDYVIGRLARFARGTHEVQRSESRVRDINDSMIVITWYAYLFIRLFRTAGHDQVRVGGATIYIWRGTTKLQTVQQRKRKETHTYLITTVAVTPMPVSYISNALRNTCNPRNIFAHAEKTKKTLGIIIEQ